MKKDFGLHDFELLWVCRKCGKSASPSRPEGTCLAAQQPEREREKCMHGFAEGVVDIGAGILGRHHINGPCEPLRYWPPESEGNSEGKTAQKDRGTSDRFNG